MIASKECNFRDPNYCDILCVFDILLLGDLLNDIREWLKPWRLVVTHPTVEILWQITLAKYLICNGCGQPCK